MALTKLPVNFQDDVLDSSMGGLRRYNMVANADGTYSFEDKTTYTQEGNLYGATQINAQNTAINTLIPTEITQTLSAGTTSLIFSNSAITSDSTINIYCNIFGISPTDMVVTDGSATLTFDVQTSDIIIKLCVY